MEVNPHNVKAHYRAAKALFALDKVDEALDVCCRGKIIDPKNTNLIALEKEIKIRAEKKHEQDEKRKKERLRQAREKMTLDAALKAREIKLRGSPRPPDLEDAAIRLSPDPLSPKSLLDFPVMLLYPTHNQSDLIKAFAEKDAIRDHLSYILPLPWDAQELYKIDTVDCYMDTITGGLIKIGKKLTLLEALTNGKTEVVDGLVRIYVVPASLAPKWIEEVKRKKNK